MGQAALAVIGKKHPQVIAAAGLQRPGVGVGMVIHFLRRLLHHLPGGLADIAVTVQRLADRGYG